MTFARITVRISASRCLGSLDCWRQGKAPGEILRAYPYLEPADVSEALRFAASLADDETIELTS